MPSDNEKQEQYEFFKYLYEEENAREETLTTRSQIYLGICTFFLGGIAWKSGELYGEIGAWSVIGVFAAISFGVAVIFNLLALRIREYEVPGDLQAILTDEFPDDGFPEGDEFHLNRLVDFAVATEENASVNNRKSDNLQYGLLAILAGLVFTTILIVAYAFTLASAETEDPAAATEAANAIAGILA